MAKLHEAYMAPGMFKFVKFSVDIVALEDSNINYNEVKLKAKLEKEMTKNSSVVGILDGGKISITLYDNGKFSGRVWASGQQLSGTYTMA